MFLQADLELSFERLPDTVRVPPTTTVGRVLHWLTLGQTDDSWKAVEPTGGDASPDRAPGGERA